MKLRTSYCDHVDPVLKQYALGLYEIIKGKHEDISDMDMTFAEFFERPFNKSTKPIEFSVRNALVYVLCDKYHKSFHPTIMQLCNVSKAVLHTIMSYHTYHIASFLEGYGLFYRAIREIPAPPIELLTESLIVCTGPHRLALSPVLAIVPHKMCILGKRKKYNMIKTFTADDDAAISQFDQKKSILKKYKTLSKTIFSLFETEAGCTRKKIFSASRDIKYLHCRIVFIILFKMYATDAGPDILPFFIGRKNSRSALNCMEAHMQYMDPLKPKTQESIAYWNLFSSISTKLSGLIGTPSPKEDVVIDELYDHPRYEFILTSEHYAKARQILESVMRVSMCTKEDICGNGSKRVLVHCRSIFTNLFFYFYPEATFESIHVLLGGDGHDRALALYAIKKHKESLERIKKDNPSLSLITYWEWYEAVCIALGLVDANEVIRYKEAS